MVIFFLSPAKGEEMLKQIFQYGGVNLLPENSEEIQMRNIY